MPLNKRSFSGWNALIIAALAMVCTLPGRTQGLGLITDPLLRDLGLHELQWANVNLVATLIGALFCIGVGRWIDRLQAPPSTALPRLQLLWG